MILINQPADDEVFDFLCKKRSEGKHYYVYMTAAANKFLRRYYGTVQSFLLTQEKSGFASEPIPAA